MSKRYFAEDFFAKSTAELSEMHTLQLMNLLQAARVYGSNWDDWAYYDPDAQADLERCSRLYNRVKAVLATRPHVLNKLEKRKLRQEAAKRKR